MEHARCRHTQAGWVSANKPEPVRLMQLKAICAACPVNPECAQYALDTSAHSGVYAGVWIPYRTLVGPGSARWWAARHLLARRAGVA
jgi:hypothetical protein